MIKLTGMQLLVLAAFLENVNIQLPPTEVLDVFPVLAAAGLLEKRDDDPELYKLSALGREVTMKALDTPIVISVTVTQTVHNTAYSDWLPAVMHQLQANDIDVVAGSVGEEFLYQSYQNGSTVAQAVEEMADMKKSQNLPRNYNRDQGVIAGDPDQLGD